MSDIFLSYASEDRERVRPLVEALTQAGWSVFWDRAIPVGKTWHDFLEEELEAARSLVIVWSNNSIRKKWVREEANEGLRMELPLFPVLLDAVLPPLGFRSIQAADLSAWDGSVTYPIFVNLVRDIKNRLGRPSSPEAIEPATSESEPEAVKPTRPKRKPAKPKEEIKTPPDKTLTNSIGMTFVLIPAGTFQMGSGISPEEKVKRYGIGADWYRGEHPQHQVTLSRPFYLQTTPVTQGQWQQVMGKNPASFKQCGKDGPVEQVSWEDAQEFIEKLNGMEKTDKYRLPTEAEWEYACRAGSTSEWCFGDEEAQLKDYAWYSKNSEETTHPVGQLQPNAWGLYDMHGQVWEWCQDWYGEYAKGPVTDPQGHDSGYLRVLRGGSWHFNAWLTRSANRGKDFPVIRDYFVGFRVARA